MSFLSRVKGAVSNLASWFGLKYDAAIYFDDRRAYVPGFLQDARLDYDSCSREEIVRKSRALEKNNAFANRMADIFEQFVAGTNGLLVIPDTSDENFNDSVEAQWETWGQYCDLTTLQGLGSFMSLCARRWFFDGDCFIHLTQGTTGLTLRGFPIFRPRIELIESHRVRTPYDKADQESKTIWDGVEVDGNGRPVAYWVRDLASSQYDTQEKYRRIPAAEMIPIFEPSRAGQNRGEPFMTSVINDLLDLQDLQRFEMLAAKDAAEISNVLTTESGELSPAFLRRNKRTLTNQDGSGGETTEDRTVYVRTVLGGRSVALKKGETLTQNRSERPSVSMQWYWNYLVDKICSGAGISALLVAARSLQGTVARGELDLADSFFQARSSVIQTAFKRVYQWWLQWSIQFDPAIDGAPSDALKVETVPPRAVNVDTGRNSASMINELRAGLTTYREEYGRLGKSWKAQIRQVGREQAFIDRIATEEGTTPERIDRGIVDILKANAASDAAEAAQTAAENGDLDPMDSEDKEDGELTPANN